MSTPTTLALLADFNAKVLAGIANNDLQEPRLSSRCCEFGQHMPALLQADHPIWKNAAAAIVWTRPEGVSNLLQAAMNHQRVDTQELLEQVDTYCATLRTAASYVTHLFVPTWHISLRHHGLGLLDQVPHLGLRWLLSKMNQRLAENLQDVHNLHVLDSGSWYSGLDAECDKMWYLAKVPYTHEVFKRAIADLKAALMALSGRGRKVLICDLDDSLWGGVVGDQGWEHLKLGGHDPIGEAFVDVQRRLKALTHRGIILGIVSKNTEQVAVEAIESHPEMQLRMRDFASWRINWRDKAQNIVELMDELNLGLEAAVFFDDNPVERARVKEALPQVLVLDPPQDPLLVPGFLSALSCFDTPSINREDRERAEMYRAERERRRDRSNALQLQSLEQWLTGLKVEVRPEPLCAANLPRAVQLLNKTNQMNLRTRRMSKQALEAWSQASNHELWLYRVSDRFGDSGITALASLSFEQETATVQDFVLSCRVMGKGVEQALLKHLLTRSGEHGAQGLCAQHLPTPRNQPCLEFWQQSGATRSGDAFTWDLSRSYAPTICATLIEPLQALQMEKVAS